MKPTYSAILVSIALILVVVFVSRGWNISPTDIGDGRSNVTIEDGIQVIAIDAKGGYLPRKSFAEAGIPTVIRFNTNATFDCSAAVRIPSLNITKTLPQSGATDIDIGTPKPGPLKGSCGMGMYPFEVEFQ